MIRHISGLIHTALALTAYASCRPHDRRRKTLASKRWLAFLGWDLHPQGSFKTFRYVVTSSHTSSFSGLSTAQQAG